MRQNLENEFALIEERGYAPYFLTVHDVVKYAREEDILCQGRGSAANSVVCFCLGVTAVNPMETELLFARFVSSERDEPPDIDVDFEHEERERVIQYIYRRYGRHRAAHLRHGDPLSPSKRHPRGRQGSGAHRGRNLRFGWNGCGAAGGRWFARRSHPPDRGLIPTIP